VTDRTHRHGAPDLLVWNRDEQQVIGHVFSPLSQKVECPDEGGETALHIERTGADELAVIDMRRNCRQHCVEMSEEKSVTTSGAGSARRENRLGIAVDSGLGMDLRQQAE
jgi:hypothetical protein